jgi:arginyl-tRNA synthetase
MKDVVIKTIKSYVKLDEKRIESLIEVPPKGMGDYAFPCFVLSSKLKKKPQDVAKELASKIKLPKEIEKVDAVGSYLNFFMNKKLFMEQTIKEINKDYGSGKKKKEKLMLEFCHVNTHKDFHIGHLRNICIGESLSRILELNGYKIIRTNYQGDIGPHVSKTIWGFINLYNEKAPAKDKGRWLGNIYSDANEKVTDSSELEEELREITKKIYSGDKSLTKVWNMTREWSLDCFNEVYKDLDVKFDKLYFESEMAKPGTEISKELLKKRVAKISDGATIVDLKKYKLGIAVLLTKDGNPLYHAKDFALAEKQFTDFKIDKNIHVVASEQDLYFKQLFKIFDLMGSKGAGKSYHLSYGLVILKTGKMSSRGGNVVSYHELKDKMMKKTIDEVKKRNKDMDEKNVDKIAKQVAIGAMKYEMLSTGSSKDLVFDWEIALKLEGDTAPYLQYSTVRAKRILEKSKTKPDFKGFEKEIEYELVKKLSEFPEIVENSASNYRPHLIVNYASSLARMFNEFYEKCPVIKSKYASSRLEIVNSVEIVLERALNLLGIEVPERM